MRKIAVCSLLLLTLPFAGRAFAQDESNTPAESKAQETAKVATPPVHYYHLDLVVQELGADKKPVNSRSYSATVSTSRQYSDIHLRTGARIPIATGSYSAANGSVSGLVNTQFQYENVGVNIDVPERADEVDSQLAFSLIVDVTSLAASIHVGGPNGIEEPVTHDNRWKGPVLIPIGKPTVVFSSENTDNKGSMQIVVTATRL
jgi:hypothetical protein